MGRKRVRQPQKHKKFIRKWKRSHGEEYVSTSGKVVPKKHCLLRDCGCKMHCSQRISEDRRRQIFEGFYNMDWNLKSSFLAGQIQVSSTKRKYTKNENSRRSKTRFYRLQDNNGEDVTVCKKFFQDTLAVCDGTITNALKRQQDSGTPRTDRRGKHTPHNKTSSDQEQTVCSFIQQFPAYESHYCRRDSNRKYLNPNLNIRIMYDMYQTECANNGNQTVSLYMFRHIFNSKFNLHFHQPQKDTCQTCDEFQIKYNSLETEAERQSVKVQHELHLRKAQAVKDMKNQDVIVARNSSGTKQVMVFDLQKTLPTPVLTTGVAYYKRQLWVYNLGIHDEVNNVGHMHIWSEHIASRGAQEVSSCLLYHINNCMPSTTKEITLYSDSCGGQNRNIKVVLALSYILQNSTIEKIDLKFFMPGHSFSSCDQDFGMIEREKKHHPHIFHPDDWVDVIKSAKKKKPKFVVHTMTSVNFFSTKALEEDITNRKVSADKDKVEWLKIRWIQLRKDEPKKMFYKYNYIVDSEELFSVVDLAKKSGRGRPSREFPSPTLLYPKGKVITKEKKKDLIDLMKYVPPQHHNFYHSLQTGDMPAHSEEED